MKISVFILASFFLFSCAQNRTEKVLERSEFKFPIVYQNKSSDTLLNFNENAISYSNFIVAKLSQKDSVKISSDPYMDTSLGHNFLKTVDRTYENDTLGTDGLELYTAYETNVYKTQWETKNKSYCYYPFYIVNGTSNKKSVLLKDQTAFGIQEALDSNGNWRPIEGRGFDFCGNGYWKAVLSPQDFLVILAPKYDGNYLTKLRIRIKIGESIYISKAFNGKINYNQFYFKKDDYLLKDLKKSPYEAISTLFYNAIPFEAQEGKLVLHAVFAN